MPRVAIAENTVGLAEPTQARFQAIDNGGGAAGAIGAGLTETSKGISAFDQQAADNQHVYDQTAVRAAYNTADAQVRSLLYTGSDGSGKDAYFNQTGFNAVGAQKATATALDKITSEAVASLRNPRQQRLFQDVFTPHVTQEQGAIAQHANQQLRVEANRQSDALQQTLSNNALDNVADPERFADYLGKGETEIQSQGALNGWAPDVVAERKAEFRSGIVAKAVDAKMTGDTTGAAAFMHDHDADLLPADRARLAASLYQPMMKKQAVGDITAGMASVVGTPTPSAPVPTGGGSTLSRLIPIIAFAESHNQERTAQGNLVTSSKGAQGAMQVMPGTNADPGFGVRPATDNSDAERSRVGRDYVTAMMGRYGGDPAKAAGAYNAGPGRVDGLIQQYGSDWLAHAPKETQSYVASTMSMLGGQAPAYAPRRDDAAKVYSWIDAQPWSDERKTFARQELDQRVTRDDMLLARQQKDGKDQAYQIINGLGPNGFTSMSQIPPNIRSVLSPEDTATFMAQAATNAKPKAVDANGDVMIGLNRMATMNPQAFAQADLRDYRSKMTPGEYSALVQLQTKQIANPDNPESVSHGKIWGVIDRYAPDLGLDLGVKDGKPKDAQSRADAATIFGMMKSDLAAQTQGKRAASDDEVKAAWDRAVMTVKVPTSGWFGTGIGASQKEEPRFKAGNTPFKVGVPDVVATRIRQAFARQGITNPSEAMISQTYMRNKGQPGFWQ